METVPMVTSLSSCQALYNKGRSLIYAFSDSQVGGFSSIKVPAYPVGTLAIEYSISSNNSWILPLKGTHTVWSRGVPERGDHTGRVFSFTNSFRQKMSPPH